jgi:hypothetical protein
MLIEIALKIILGSFRAAVTKDTAFLLPDYWIF